MTRTSANDNGEGRGEANGGGDEEDDFECGLDGRPKKENVLLVLIERVAEEVLAQLLTVCREGRVKVDAFAIYQVSFRSSAYRKGLTCVLKAAL